jgi:hypothetical protein
MTPLERLLALIPSDVSLTQPLCDVRVPTLLGLLVVLVVAWLSVTGWQMVGRAMGRHHGPDEPEDWGEDE